MSDIGTELEAWLRAEALDRLSKARARRSYAIDHKLSPEDVRAAHRIAEQMAGRKLPGPNPAAEERDRRMQSKIADRLTEESARLLRFADFVNSMEGAA